MKRVMRNESTTFMAGERASESQRVAGSAIGGVGFSKAPERHERTHRSTRRIFSGKRERARTRARAVRPVNKNNMRAHDTNFGRGFVKTRPAFREWARPALAGLVKPQNKALPRRRA